MIREYVLQHINIFKSFSFFLFTLLGIECVPLPLALPRFLLSAEFFHFLCVQYGLSLDFHSVLQAVF